MLPKIKIGDFVECCNPMPGVVMKINESGDDIEIRMLDVDSYQGQSYYNCSLNHCGIVKLTANQVRDRLILGKKELTRLWSIKGCEENPSKYEKLIQEKVLDKNLVPC